MADQNLENKNFAKIKFKQFEKEYAHKRDSTLMTSHKILSSITLACCFASLVINLIYKNSSHTWSFDFVLFSSYTNAVINTILFVIALFSKNKKILRFIQYSNYIFLLFTFANFRYAMIKFVYSKTAVVMIIIVLIELIFRTIWVLYRIFNFREFLLLNLIQVGLIYVYLLPTLDPSTANLNFYNLFCYSILFGIITFLSYVLDKQHKADLLLICQLKDKNNYLRSILENINTGILTITNNKLFKMNQSSKNILFKYLKINLNNDHHGK